MRFPTTNPRNNLHSAYELACAHRKYAGLPPIDFDAWFQLQQMGLGAGEPPKTQFGKKSTRK